MYAIPLVLLFILKVFQFNTQTLPKKRKSKRNQIKPERSNIYVVNTSERSANADKFQVSEEVNNVKRKAQKSNVKSKKNKIKPSED